MNQRPAVPAHAAPTTPSCGRPNQPYTSAAHSRPLTTFPATMVITTGRGRCIACSDWRNTRNANAGSEPGIDARANAAANGITSGGWRRMRNTGSAGR